MPVMTKAPDGQDIVILSKDEYDTLVSSAEDRADAAEIERSRARREAGEELLTSEEVDELLAAKTPLAFWRKKRNLTQGVIAQRVGVAQGFISEIEAGRKRGDVQILLRIANVLDVKLDDLVTNDLFATHVAERDRLKQKLAVLKSKRLTIGGRRLDETESEIKDHECRLELKEYEIAEMKTIYGNKD